MGIFVASGKNLKLDYIEDHGAKKACLLAYTFLYKKNQEWMNGA